MLRFDRKLDDTVQVLDETSEVTSSQALTDNAYSRRANRDFDHDIEATPCSPQLVLSCLAMTLFGFVFGFIGFVLEVVGRRDLQSRDTTRHSRARQLRLAAYVISIVGIVIGWIVLVVVLVTLFTNSKGSDVTESAPAAGVESVSLEPNSTLSTVNPPTPYCIQSDCYRYVSFLYSCASCLAVGGVFKDFRCYHNSENCTGYIVDTHCFTSRSPVNNILAKECSPGQYFGHDGYCYYTEQPDCQGGFHFNCACYNYNSTSYTYSTCNNINGYYFGGVSDTLLSSYLSTTYVNGTCYYNSFNCTSGYIANDQCYANVSTTFTAGTCRNIRGYIVPREPASTDSLPPDAHQLVTCYHNNFRCPFVSTLGQCFRSSITQNSGYSTQTSGSRCTTCFNYGGFYRRGYCLLYEDAGHSLYSTKLTCPYIKVGDRCEQFNETGLNSTMCDAVGGYFQRGYYSSYVSRLNTVDRCFYTNLTCPDNQFLSECRCFTNQSTELTKGTCENIGGSYDSTQIVCYYNSTVCPFYNYQGQCYELRSRQSQARSQCNGVYDYFNGVCYSNPYRYGP